MGAIGSLFPSNDKTSKDTNSRSSEKSSATSDVNTPEDSDDEKYEKAMALQKEGKYEDAISIYTSLSGYKKSDDLINDCYYQLASRAMEEKDYSSASDYIDQIDSNYPELESLKSRLQQEYGLIQQLVGNS